MNTFDFSIIKTLRMKWGLTAEELATRSKITRATVTKIESGNGNPTIETLEALSRVFHLSASELIRMAEMSICEEGQNEAYDDEGLSGTRVIFHNFEIYHLNASSGTVRQSEPRNHDNTAEVCMVITGKIRLTIQGETHELGPNAAFRFKALSEHRIEVVEDAEFLMIHHNLP